MSAPWDDASFPWDERPLHGTDAPTVVEAVVRLKSWEVVAEKGKETLHLRGSLLLYWTDPRLVGFPTKAKGENPPEKIWRPGLITCAGFGLGPAENYEQVPRFYAGGLDKQGGRHAGVQPDALELEGGAQGVLLIRRNHGCKPTSALGKVNGVAPAQFAKFPTLVQWRQVALQAECAPVDGGQFGTFGIA